MAFTIHLLKSFLFVPLAYLEGLWFLFAHPIMFLKFVKEWKRFQQAIGDQDEITASGYHDLNRATRRKLQRAVR